jgi:hypothetical protein
MHANPHSLLMRNDRIRIERLAIQVHIHRSLGIDFYDCRTMYLLWHPHSMIRILAVPHRTEMLYSRLLIQQMGLQYRAPIIFTLYHFFFIILRKGTAFPRYVKEK